MNKFFYFKLAFVFVFVFVFISSLLNGIFDLDFSNNEAITKLFLRSFVKALITAVVLGLLNISFKFGAAKDKK